VCLGFERPWLATQTKARRGKRLTQRSQRARSSQRRETQTDKENREKRECGAFERGSPDPSTAQRQKAPLLRSG
jgi:hypothetical protein